MALSNGVFTPKLASLAAIMVHFAVTAGCAQYPASASNPADLTTTKISQSAQNPIRDGSVEELVTFLSSSDTAVRTAAEDELLKMAQSSTSRRETVISALLNSVRQIPELNGSHTDLSVTTLAFWESFTSLAWRLKAIEAIDAMITCIHCSNGYSGNMGEPPAAYAIVRMGPPAVPKLSDALLQEDNGYKRINLVLCLSRIGGPESKRALTKALSTEKDKQSAATFVVHFAIFAVSTQGYY